MATLIDGKAISQEILSGLAVEIKELQNPPLLAVILVGNNEASLAYIRQKQKAATLIGAKVTVYQLPETISQSDLLRAIADIQEGRGVEWQQYTSSDQSTAKPDAIIVQRPLPETIDYAAVLEAINPAMDIDGFHANSPFDPPVAMAVLEAIAHALSVSVEELPTRIAEMPIALVGAGDTAGKPILKTLEKYGITCTVVNRDTENPKEVTKTADIVIVAVGKPKLITAEWISPQSIVIDVGISRGTEGLVGDVDEGVSKIAKAITPVPGGIGPLNVACLMQNLVDAKNHNRL